MLEGVSRSYGAVKAVVDLSLTLEEGRIYGLLGPNGAGKSTTTRLMLGFSGPDEGRVELLGGAPSASRRGRVGFVPEVRALAGDAQVHDLLVFYGRMRGLPRADAVQTSRRWLDRFELSDKASSKVQTLSNGQQQKVQIAMALLTRPDLLVLDEPLTALDPTHQTQALEAFSEVAAAGATVLLATHRLWEAEAFVHHVVLMNAGRKVLDDTLDNALATGASNTWRIRASSFEWLDDMGASVAIEGDVATVQLQPGTEIGALLANAGTTLRSVEEVLPSLHEVFLANVQ